LDRCQLRQLPSLIGECQSLNVLQVRNNQLEELPMEIGKLAKLKVFDVCNNMLTHLPYTVCFLFLKLRNDFDNFGSFLNITNCCLNSAINF